MSKQTTSAVRSTDEGTRTRWRQYRITARLLKEYTARLREIADLLGKYRYELDASRPGTPISGSVVTAVGEFRLIWDDVLDAALAASQMLVHYGLDEAEATELRTRLKGAEYFVGRTADLVNAINASNYKVDIGPPMTADRLKAVIELSRLALKR